MIKFTIPGEPVAKGRPRVTKTGIAYTPKKTKDYETLVQEIYFSTFGQTMFTEPLTMHINAYFKIPKTASKKKKEQMLQGIIRPVKKPDCDNIVKSIADALNNIAYEDDKQLVRVSIDKFYSDTPRAEVILEKLE
jgi:Holliday junction resolvase RusA-like endonuclease